jgi:hypothetical protein
MNVYYNGAARSSSNFTTTGPWTLAQIGAWYSTYFMNGDVAEILMYDPGGTADDEHESPPREPRRRAARQCPPAPSPRRPISGASSPR